VGAILRSLGSHTLSTLAVSAPTPLLFPGIPRYPRIAVCEILVPRCDGREPHHEFFSLGGALRRVQRLASLPDRRSRQYSPRSAPAGESGNVDLAAAQMSPEVLLRIRGLISQSARPALQSMITHDTGPLIHCAAQLPPPQLSPATRKGGSNRTLRPWRSSFAFAPRPNNTVRFPLRRGIKLSPPRSRGRVRVGGQTLTSPYFHSSRPSNKTIPPLWGRFG
jgi:hypothetical protein